MNDYFSSPGTASEITNHAKEEEIKKIIDITTTACSEADIIEITDDDYFAKLSLMRHSYCKPRFVSPMFYYRFYSMYISKLVKINGDN